MTNKEIADRLFIDEDEINPVSSCCSAAVSDPSGEGIEGRCTDCGEMCSIVEETQDEQRSILRGESRMSIDEIVERIRRGMERELGGTSPHLGAGFTRNEAEEAITSLIRELVAEAKPARAIISDDELGIDRARKSAANHAINEFEQNLLKALLEDK